MITIRLIDANGETLGEAAHPEEALLFIKRAWHEGDEARISAPAGAHLWLTLDAGVPSGEVFVPSGVMRWRPPFGTERLSYSPGAFAGDRLALSARLMRPEEISRTRDLARNPLDLRGDTQFFPHCTANVETRGEAVFAARNVIDGLRFNSGHGAWPFESWGIGAREDAYLTLDFGREVIADEMALTLRADFPHDAYWVSGHAVTDGGKDIAFELKKTEERQFIPLGGIRLRSIRLERLIKSYDPSAFPSLRALEVFGRDEIKDA